MTTPPTSPGTEPASSSTTTTPPPSPGRPRRRRLLRRSRRRHRRRPRRRRRAPRPRPPRPAERHPVGVVAVPTPPASGAVRRSGGAGRRPARRSAGSASAGPSGRAGCGRCGRGRPRSGASSSGDEVGVERDDVDLLVEATERRLRLAEPMLATMAVDRHDLGVEHRRLVVPDRHAVVEQPGVARLGGELHEPLVGVGAGDQDLDVDPPVGGVAQPARSAPRRGRSRRW